MGAVRCLVFGLLAGCTGGVGENAPAAPWCAPARSTPFIYHGTDQPSYVPLTPGQRLAIGTWVATGQPYCSGTLIAPDWVLTAAHCKVHPGDRFCFGQIALQGTCLLATEVFERPYVVADGEPSLLDLSLVRLERAAATVVPVEPIPILTDPELGYTGQPVEVAGFGFTDTGGQGVLQFAEEVIDQVAPADDGREYVRVDGLGRRGACLGDSGGPMMVIGAGGRTRVAGVLSWGDASCVDLDRYTRVDLAAPWIRAIAGPPVEIDGGCGPLDELGRCAGLDRALWCEQGQVASQACPEGEVCGWNGTAYRCITPDWHYGYCTESAGNHVYYSYDRVGVCADNQAIWCDRGTLEIRTCSCGNQICGFDADVPGVNCVDDPCEGVGPGGRCEGNVFETCFLGRLERTDCGSQTCSLDADTGYGCH